MRTGRPTTYRKNFPERGFMLWVEGKTDREVAKALKISHESLYQHVKRYPEFADARKKAKAMADEVIEQSLFNRARGMWLPDCHVSQYEGVITVTPLKKHLPPDPLSCIFWLKNRKPDQWREKTELALTTDYPGLDQETITELRALAKWSAEVAKLTYKAPGNGGGVHIPTRSQKPPISQS